MAAICFTRYRQRRAAIAKPTRRDCNLAVQYSKAHADVLTDDEKSVLALIATTYICDGNWLKAEDLAVLHAVHARLGDDPVVQLFPSAPAK